MAQGPLKIGITGGIGSGKSTICKVFASLGIPIYDADSRARWVMNNNPSLKKEIITAFGNESYNEKGLNREYLGKLVFTDHEKTNKLNGLVHPAVGKDFEDWASQQTSAPYVVKEAALLIESGSYKQLDKLILVTAPEEVRIQRVLQRDKHRTREDVKNVIQRQMPEEEKKKYCQLVIENDGNTAILPIILEFHAALLAKS